MRTWLVAAVSALVLSGCLWQPDRPDAVTWAGSVCEALNPWRAEIDELTGTANAAMTPDSSPVDAKGDLLGLLSGAAEATQAAHDAVVSAGVPDVADGEAIADRFVDSLAGTRDAYRVAHDELAALDASAEGFYDDVAQVMADLVDDYAAVPQVAALDSVELSDAFETAPACR